MTEINGVHPVADLFPMLADDELAELAEDIKQRGLLHPIVLDGAGRVLDGRNRLAACELAGVEATFTSYDGDDPDGYALAVNGQRRAQTKGQKALVAAAYLNDLNQKRKTQRAVAQALGVTEALISQAVLIGTYAREQSAAVMVTGAGFADALRTATERKREAEEAKAKLERLRVGAPDLLSLVDEERMSLDDALALLDAREEKARQEEDERIRQQREQEEIERERRIRNSGAFGAALMQVWAALDPDPVSYFERTWEPSANPHRGLPNAKDLYVPKGLRRIAEHLAQLADHLDDNHKDLL
jgi:ParB-like chromosome segregation protein Spo0J